MPTKWLVEGDDAAVLAQAINNGTLTKELQSIKAFFDPEVGPGADIGERYNYHNPKGRRNLKLNVTKLFDKIQKWKTQKPGDSKRVRFSEAFLKKGKFPKRPELVSDVPPSDDFTPGRDAAFEEVVRQEREDEDSDASLSDIEAELRDIEQDEDEPNQKEDSSVENIIEEVVEQNIMPPRQQGKLTLLKQPFKMAGQDEVSFALLRPKIGYMTVADPAYKRRNGSLSRTCLVVRVDIPSGVVRQSFVPDISMDGKRITFSCYYDQSRHHAQFTCGSMGTPDIVMAMDGALATSWSYIHDNCQVANKGGEVREYQSLTLVLPEPVEREFRDFTNGWEECPVGAKGAIIELPKAEGSRFYYSYLFTVNSKEKTPARATVNTLLHMDISFEDNPMTAQNLARQDFDNHQMFAQLRTPKPRSTKKEKRSQKKIKGKSSIADELQNMSIADTNDDSEDSSIESRVISVRRRKSKRPASDSMEDKFLERIAERIRKKVAEAEKGEDGSDDVPSIDDLRDGTTIQELKELYGDEWWNFDKGSSVKNYDPRIVNDDNGSSSEESYSSARSSDDRSRSRRTRKSERKHPPKT